MSSGAADDVIREHTKALVATISDYKEAAKHARKMKPKQTKPAAAAAAAAAPTAP